MIVIGIDPHQATHTAVAVEGATGALLGELTVRAHPTGYEELLLWARELSAERRFALENVRSWTGSLERFLIGHGEEVVRVPTKLMAKLRFEGRRYGKSDEIDALATARAALREPDLPAARLDGPELEIRLLVDHREALVQERTRVQNRLRACLRDVLPDLELPLRVLRGKYHVERVGRLLARCERTAQVEIAREWLRRNRELNKRCRELEERIHALVQEQAPGLLDLPGCGPLCAGRIIGEVAGIDRFATPAKLAMHAGVAPLPASSGKVQRHRLNRFGNRKLNRALYIVAQVQAREYGPAKDYMARRQSEGKSRREALRCLKRHLAYRVFKLLSEAQANAAEVTS